MLAMIAPTPVQLNHRAAPVEAVVAELARRSGRPLAVRPEMRDEVVYVALGPRPADETMRLVARATSAEWTTDAGRTYLGRSAVLRRAQAKAERAARAAEIAKRLQKTLAPDDATPWRGGYDPIRPALAMVVPIRDGGGGGERWDEIRTRLVAFTPAGRLLSRTLRALGPEGLADVPLGTVVHYASRPRRWQSPMPGLTPASLGQFAAESAILDARLAALPPEERKETAGNLCLYGDSAGRPPAADGGVVLRISRDADDDFSMMLDAFDAQGRTTITQRLDLYSPVGPRPAAFSDSDRWAKTVPKLPTLALDLDRRDPMVDLGGPPAAALMDAVGGESIVALPDAFPAQLRNVYGEGPTLGGISRTLGSFVIFEKTDGVFVGRARKPIEAESIKTARAPMRSLLRRFPDGTSPDLETTLAYLARQNPLAPQAGLEGLALARLTATCEPLASAVRGRGLYSTLAALAPEQRGTLLAGGALPYRAFPEAAKEAMRRWAFTKGVEIAEAEGKVVDPTVWFDDLPAEASFAVSQRVAWLRGIARVKGSLVGYDVEGLGYAQAQQEKGATPDRAYPDVVKGLFRPARAELLMLSLDLGGGTRLTGRVDDYAVGPKEIPLAQFPPEFLKAYQEAYEAAKKGG